MVALVRRTLYHRPRVARVKRVQRLGQVLFGPVKVRKKGLGRVREQDEKKPGVGIEHASEATPLRVNDVPA